MGWAPTANAWHLVKFYLDEGIQTLWVDGVKRKTRNLVNIYPITYFMILARRYDYIGDHLAITRVSGVLI